MEDGGIVGVGSPQMLLLEQFGHWIWDAFGTPPYLVGSAARGKIWRDVDVRLILDDDTYWALFPHDEQVIHNKKWTLICTGISLVGKQMTGLPIDFQIQTQTHANGFYHGKTRVPLGVV